MTLQNRSDFTKSHHVCAAASTTPLLCGSAGSAPESPESVSAADCVAIMFTLTTTSRRSVFCAPGNGLDCRTKASEIWCAVWGSGFGVEGLRFRVQGSGFRVQEGVEGLGLRVQGLRFRVKGVGLRI